MTGTGRPLPGCPARPGAGSFDVGTADFLFHVADCRNAGSPDGPVTEIFGFFSPPGWALIPAAGARRSAN